MYHTQNLSDGKQSLFWWGRAWLDLFSKKFKTEWMFGLKASGPSLKMDFGEGDSDADVCFHICIPWVCSLYFTVEKVWRTKPFWLGFYIYEKCSYCISLAAYSNESNRSDPWYRKTFYRDFPWALRWHSTEVLKEESGGHKVVWREDRSSRIVGDTFEIMRNREAAEKTVEVSSPYRYVLKDGTIQEVIATYHLVRMEWRARWYPLIPIKKSSTSIDFKFSSEVGEGAGSWKGGVIGSGYNLNHEESASECLKRMERDRKFDR